MFKTLTTTLGLALMTGSLAFAAQAPSTNSNQPATKPAVVQTTPSGSSTTHATSSTSVKKHKKHHKRAAAANVTPKSSAPKSQ